MPIGTRQEGDRPAGSRPGGLSCMGEGCTTVPDQEDDGGTENRTSADGGPRTTEAPDRTTGASGAIFRHANETKRLDKHSGLAQDRRSTGAAPYDLDEPLIRRDTAGRQGGETGAPREPPEWPTASTASCGWQAIMTNLLCSEAGLQRPSGRRASFVTHRAAAHRLQHERHPSAATVNSRRGVRPADADDRSRSDLARVRANHRKVWVLPREQFVLFSPNPPRRLTRAETSTAPALKGSVGRNYKGKITMGFRDAVRLAEKSRRATGFLHYVARCQLAHESGWSVTRWDGLLDAEMDRLLDVPFSFDMLNDARGLPVDA